MALATFLARLRKPDIAAQAPVLAGLTQPTRGLPRFVSALSGREHPALLDLGPVVGANVTFFGEQLGCKIFVEDLSKDFDSHVRADRVHDLPEFFGTRFPQEAATFDGIICWDVFDYLDRQAGQALAQQLVRLLRPEGVLFGFFNHSEVLSSTPIYTRHAVLDQRTLEYRPYGGARGKQRPFPNREIQRMFAPLTITDQFLQKTNVREIVLRKPASPNGAGGGAVRYES